MTLLFNMIIVNALMWASGSMPLSNNTNGCFVLFIGRVMRPRPRRIWWIGWHHCGLQPGGYVEGLPIFGGGNGFVCGTTVVGITIIGINWCNACMFSGHSAFERVDVSSRVLSNFDSKTL